MTNLKCSWPECLNSTTCNVDWHPTPDDHSECQPICPNHTKLLEFVESRLVRSVTGLVETTVTRMLREQKAQDRDRGRG